MIPRDCQNCHVSFNVKWNLSFTKTKMLYFEFFTALKFKKIKVMVNWFETETFKSGDGS